jgi:hypothetical protein
MDRLPVNLLYLSKEFNVKSTTKDIKTIHANIIYAIPRLLSIRHYFAAKMAVQKSGASLVLRILYQRLLGYVLKVYEIGRTSARM